MSDSAFAQTVLAIRAALPQDLQYPSVGIVCGSGLSGLGEVIQNIVYLPYDGIPGFTASTVPGHKNSLAFGFIGSLPVVAMLGRVSEDI
jgi:purine-nucleoside phosphorylase